MSGLVFFGTPEAALPCLEAVDRRSDIRLVVTMPDRPRGRRGTPQPSPVKERALELGLAVAQPGSRAELERALETAGPFDIGVLVAYGLIITKAALEAPKHGIVNVHFSLLPRWRGAAPVERAIEAGDTVTGTSLMLIEEGLDTGPVYDSWATGIGQEETAGELTDRLATGGAELLDVRLGELIAGSIAPTPQPREGVCYADRIVPDDARISAAWSAESLLAKIRAYNPRPGAFASVDGVRFKVWRARRAEGSISPGTLIPAETALLMGTSTEPIELVEVQSAGGSRVSGVDWARGHRGDTWRLE